MSIVRRSNYDGNNVMNLHLECGETAIVEFCPEGANARPGSPTLGFTIGTVTLPNSEMALRIAFPPRYTYREQRGGLYLLKVDCQPTEMILDLHDGTRLELQRFEMGEQNDVVEE